MPESVNTHMTPVALKINACVDPIGIDTPRPLFQWMLCAQRGNCYQSAYRIVVMDDSGNTVWDTGKVCSDRQLQIPYGGEPLLSMTRYRWRVMVWDQEDMPSDWSGEARFEMGLLQPSDWKAQWIGGSCDYNPLDGLHWIGCHGQPAKRWISAALFSSESPCSRQFLTERPLGAGSCSAMERFAAE